MDKLARSPRFAGSDSEKRCRDECASLLRASGFETFERSFEFSEFPARWAPSIISFVLAASCIAAGFFAVSRAEPFNGLAVLMLPIVAIGAPAHWMARHGTRRVQVLRSQSANLFATRPGAPGPPVWLVAHLDSKSQTIPMLLRVVSIAVFVMLFTALMAIVMALAFISVTNPMEAPLTGGLAHVSSILSFLAAASIFPVMVCFVGNRSRGALDNATGVAAILLASRMVPREIPVGVLITSGEELALAGARVIASSMEGRVALNCDTVDDPGHFICMASGKPSMTLDEAIDRAALRTAVNIVHLPRLFSKPTRSISPMLPGILADNVAFTDAGWDSVTLSRGNLRTLSRVHTSKDRPENLEGTGIVQAARFLAAAVEELT